MNVQLKDIPGLERAFSRAQAIEDRLRDAAFLPVLEEINGLPVRQFTLRHLLILFAIKSPFVCGGPRTVEAVAAFLWLVSPGYNTAAIGRAEFLAEIGCVERGDLFWRGIERYLDRALMDRPSSTGKSMPAHASIAASVGHRIAKEYGWDDDVILDKPLARLYQYINLIACEADPKRLGISRLSDGVKARRIRQYLAKEKAKAQEGSK